MRKFTFLFGLIVLLLSACGAVAVLPTETPTILQEYSTISFLEHETISSEVSGFVFTGIEGLDLGELGVHGIQFVELTLVTNGISTNNACSIFLDTPPLLLCSGPAFDSGTVIEVQFFLRDKLIWEGEIVIPESND